MASVRNNPTELAPKLEIFDQNDVEQHTFETTKIAASPTQDFTMTDLSLRLGVGSDWGTLVFLFNDNSNTFTKNTIRRESTIERQWRVKLQLGKTIAGLSTWFDGKILDTQVIRQGTNQQSQMITCVGWGDVLRNRYTKLIRNQKKGVDGIDLDDTDTTVRIDELIMDLTNDTDHQIDDNIPALTSITFDNTDVNKICATCLDIKIPNINMTYSSFATTISRLVALSSSMWMVDANRDLIVRDPFSHDSEFLYTNDLGNFEEQNWDATKLGYILNGPISWTDSSSASLYNFIHGVGPFGPLLDVKFETAPDASDNLDDMWHAIPIKPTQDNIFKIAVKAIKTGTPVGIAEVLITSGDLTLGPDTNDIRRTIKLNGKTLQSLGTSVPADWFEIPLKPRLGIVADEQLFIVFKTFGTVANTYNVNYLASDTTNKFWDSTNGTSWTERANSSSYRVYSGRRVELTLEDVDVTAVIGEPREKLIPLRADMEVKTAEQALLAAGDILGQSVRRYDAIIVSAPDTRPPLLQTAKIVDSATGLAIQANLIGLLLEMHAGTNTSIGTDRLELQFEDLFI